MKVDKISLAEVFIERFEKEIGKIVLFSGGSYKEPLALELSKLKVKTLYNLNSSLWRKHRRELNKVRG